MTWLSRVTPEDVSKADKVMAGWLAAKALPPVGAMVLWQDPPDEPYLQRYTSGTGALIRDCVIGDWLTGILINPTDPGTPTHDRLVDETWPQYQVTFTDQAVSIRKVPVA